MILSMARVRLLGPRPALPATLAVLQDLEVLHLAPPCDTPGCRPVQLSPELAAEREALRRGVADVEACRRLLAPVRRTPWQPLPVHVATLAKRIAHVATVRFEIETLDGRRRALVEERLLLVRYRDIVQGFGPILAHREEEGTMRAIHLVVPAAERDTLEVLREALAARIGDGVEVLARPLPAGDLAAVVLFACGHAEEVDGLVREASLQDLSAPEAYGGGALTAAMPRMLSRLDEIPVEAARVEADLVALAAREGSALDGTLATAHDRLAELDALERAAETERAFVLEGWVPEPDVDTLSAALASRIGPEVVVERVAVEEWAGRPTPVKLHNPPIFRPFEALTALLPLPAYGTIDPTPFVAIGFPMLFGIILGDVAYGVVLAAIAIALRLRSKPGTMLRSVAAIGGACAAFTVIFGVLYGELLGDLGHRWFGMEPLALNREESVVPALVLAIGIGLVHILLGMVLGVINAARGEPRKAVGRAAGLVMFVLVVLALLAVFGVLPGGLLTPMLVGVLLVFPVLVAAEGLLAPVELLSTFANVLSYARIMAVGTASVMMAVVANRLAGAVGSVLVGVLFALLFHLVNFAIGVFGPAVHVLRLHYVEFFGKFYSPGGTAYTPLRHWHPTPPSG